MAKKKSRKEKGSWQLTLRQIQTISVICNDCTQEEAKNDPWTYAVYDSEEGDAEYKVLDIEPYEG